MSKKQVIPKFMIKADTPVFSLYLQHLAKIDVFEFKFNFLVMQNLMVMPGIFSLFFYLRALKKQVKNFYFIST